MFSFFKKKKKEEPKVEEVQVVEEVQEELVTNSTPDKEENTPSKDETTEEVVENIQKEEEPSKEEAIVEEIIEEKIEPEVIEEVAQEVVEEKIEEPKEEKKGFFSRALEKTFASIKTVVPQKKEKIAFDDIEEMLIEADMEYEIIEKAMDGLPEEITRKQLRHRLVMLFEHAPDVDLNNLPKPFVRLIIGVNGAGKTTTIAKLANKSKKEGKSVILGAGDTFRAAAIEQLATWADKLDVPIIKTKQGHDSSAVAYDTISSAVSKNIDNVIIDTAGRLQTQTNLNNELKKIVKVCGKAQENAPHQKLMILDGTQGNTAIAQARAFNEMVGIDGIIVTKLDGTAKGGALFSISNQLELPIFFVGIGEKQDDLIEFSPDAFVDSLLDEIYTEEK